MRTHLLERFDCVKLFRGIVLGHQHFPKRPPANDLVWRNKQIERSGACERLTACVQLVETASFEWRSILLAGAQLESKQTTSYQVVDGDDE